MGVALFVPGPPAPQGSKRHVGKGVMIESSKALKPWREDIRAAFSSAFGGKLVFGPGVAVVATLQFVMPRPVSTPKRVTPQAVKKADLDKLVRAVFDALTSSGAPATSVSTAAASATRNSSPSCPA